MYTPFRIHPHFQFDDKYKQNQQHPPYLTVVYHLDILLERVLKLKVSVNIFPVLFIYL